jgi:hypothetical protein
MDVARKPREPQTKAYKGKTYHWCVNYKNPQWSLHNPSAFPNLCKIHHNYQLRNHGGQVEREWNASGRGAKGVDCPGVTATDIQLEGALACIEDSDSEFREDGCQIVRYVGRHDHPWQSPALWLFP